MEIMHLILANKCWCLTAREERKGMERRGNERNGKERKQKERKEQERKGKRVHEYKTKSILKLSEYPRCV